MVSVTFREFASFLIVAFSIVSLLITGVEAITGADPSSPTASTWTQSSSGAAISGGNVYNATVSVSEQTYRWAALWGNISGSIVLNNEDGNAVISWIVTQIQDASVVYATTNDGTLDPTDFTAFTNANLQNTDAAYGYATTVTDSITNTYTATALFQSPSMSSGISANTTIKTYIFKLGIL